MGASKASLKSVGQAVRKGRLELWGELRLLSPGRISSPGKPRSLKAFQLIESGHLGSWLAP